MVDSTKDVPPLVLLAYHEQPPNLRVLKLRERAATAAPVSLDAMETAISEVVPRETWVAFDGGQEVWAAGVPLGDEATRIAPSFDCVPAGHPDHIWITRHEGVGMYRGSREFREVNATGETYRSLPAQRNERIDACTPQGLVVRTIWDGPEESPRPRPLLLRDPDTGAERELSDLRGVSAAHGSALLLNDLGTRNVLVDVAADTTIEVANPGIGRWQQSPTFSPDGSLIAIGADLNRPDPNRPSIAEIVKEGYQSPPRPSVLVLIETKTGHTTVVDGQFENFAWRPVWSRDGEWIVFAAPFEEDKLRLVPVGENQLLTLPFPGTCPAPLLDTTGTRILAAPLPGMKLAK